MTREQSAQMGSNGICPTNFYSRQSIDSYTGVYPIAPQIEFFKRILRSNRLYWTICSPTLLSRRFDVKQKDVKRFDLFKLCTVL